MVTLFKCNSVEDAIARPNDCLLFTWANRSVHGLGRWISSRNRTHEFHLAKNRRERVKLVSKMGLKKWNTDFLLEYYDRENWTTLTFRTLRSFQEFFTDTTPQVVFLNFSYWCLGNIFVNGKQKAMSNSTDANFRLKGSRPVLFYIITGLPVAQLSFKMGLVFPSGTNRTLACSARAQDIRVCME